DSIDDRLVKDLADFLSSFKTCSEQLSADTEPTLYLVVPWIRTLRLFCEDKTSDLLYIVQLKKSVLEKLEDKMWLTHLHYIGTFLHLVTKNLLVLSEEERQNVYSDTRKILETVGIIPQQQQSTSTTKKNNTKKHKREFITHTMFYLNLPVKIISAQTTNQMKLITILKQN
ncbi:unnamed protein product, partial [Didymodactylos carnosus]